MAAFDQVVKDVTMLIRPLLACGVLCIAALVLIALGWHWDLQFAINLGLAVAITGLTILLLALFPPV